MMLYVTDVDNTILPLDRSKFSSKGLEQWKKRIKEADMKTGYISGRNLEQLRETLKELPEPDLLITDVGTRIHHYAGGKWQEDKEFAEFLSNAWQGQTREKVKQALFEVEELREQEPEALSRFKQSYYLDSGYNPQEVLVKIRNSLKEADLESDIRYSVDEAKGVGLIDVLPKNSGKSGAIEFLMRRYELAPDQVIYSGDSGNDVDALISGWRGILVGNARPEIKEEVKEKAPRPENVYIAEQYFVSGVLEGFDHFGV